MVKRYSSESIHFDYDPMVEQKDGEWVKWGHVRDDINWLLKYIDCASLDTSEYRTLLSLEEKYRGQS